MRPSRELDPSGILLAETDPSPNELDAVSAAPRRGGILGALCTASGPPGFPLLEKTAAFQTEPTGPEALPGRIPKAEREHAPAPLGPTPGPVCLRYSTPILAVTATAATASTIATTPEKA